eukprot:m.844799 g.844799  ORF g.844799 m.844799 type:complete len:77 (-) comp59545_c0_seq15:3368-3598(-)
MRMHHRRSLYHRPFSFLSSFTPSISFPSVPLLPASFTPYPFLLSLFFLLPLLFSSSPFFLFPLAFLPSFRPWFLVE